MVSPSLDGAGMEVGAAWLGEQRAAALVAHRVALGRWNPKNWKSSIVETHSYYKQLYQKEGYLQLLYVAVCSRRGLMVASWARCSLGGSKVLKQHLPGDRKRGGGLLDLSSLHLGSVLLNLFLLGSLGSSVLRTLADPWL